MPGGRERDEVRVIVADVFSGEALNPHPLKSLSFFSTKENTFDRALSARCCLEGRLVIGRLLQVDWKQWCFQNPQHFGRDSNCLNH